jgi:hypothetical protein
MVLHFTVTEVLATWGRYFLAFNPSSSTCKEYLLTYVGSFGASETAQCFVKRIPSLT